MGEGEKEAERETKTETLNLNIAQAFETSKLTPSDTFLSTRQYLLEGHTYMSLWEPFLFNLPQPPLPLQTLLTCL